MRDFSGQIAVVGNGTASSTLQKKLSLSVLPLLMLLPDNILLQPLAFETHVVQYS